MKKLVTALVAVLGIGGIAAAADLPDEPVLPPPAPERFDWTGFYIGLQAGYGWSQVDTRFDNGAPSVSPDGDGFLGGAHVGYLYQWDSFVLGAEADIEFSDINGSDSSLAGATAASRSDINWMASLRLRAGFAWDRVLVYATGGLAYADFDGSGGPAGGPLQSYSDEVWGWTLGGGLDYGITENWRMRAEYRYTDFEDASGGLAPLYAGVTASTDVDLHAVRLGVSYRF